MRHLPWIGVALAAVACSDSGGTIVDARAIDAPGFDATTSDAPAPDAATPDAATPDAGLADAPDLDSALAIDAIAVTIDAPIVPLDAAIALDAPATTTQSTWTAASGQLPDQLSCAPWELTDTSTPEQPMLNGTELILSNNVDSESMYYLHPAAVLALPPVLIIEARVEHGLTSSQGPSRSSTAISFAEGPTDRKNTLFIDEGVVFLLSAENTRGPSATMPTSDTPHDYRIEVTLATGAIAVFRDNVPLLTGALFVSPYDVPTAIYWGESSIVAHGTSIWERVSHNALAATACP